MDKEKVIKYYLESNLQDVIEDGPCNHFNLASKDKLCNSKEVAKISRLSNSSIINPIKNAEITIENKIQLKAETIHGEKIELNTKDEYIVNSNNKNDFNYIYKNLANKYKNDNINLLKENMITVDMAINKARQLADNAKDIDELKQAVENFDGYLDIKKLATNTVFGEGNRNAEIMIIGEAPGNSEDLEGRPFCGYSGQLLDSMFKSIGLNRESLYITNTLFWRPPGNRTPTQEETDICRPFVEKHIALINPKLIICMGATALKDLINTDLTITKARREIFLYTNKYLDREIKTTPLFHPSYLLRQSIKKKNTWGDLLNIKNILKSN